MEFFAQYGLFALKTLTLVCAILVTFGAILTMGRKIKPELIVTALHNDHENLVKYMHKKILGSKYKSPHPKKTKKPSVYIVDFNGDIKASQTESLRSEISAILTTATPKDEVVIRLESPGGTVNGYGLAAAQIQRLRDRKIPITVCIDKIAASGGYLMACVANRILAAPFAIVGSIGVVAQLPNFHRWLQKNDIDVELLTAGEYKRTLTVFGKNTPKGRAKFLEDLEAIHTAFRHYILTNRKRIDIDTVGTGEHWLGTDAIGLHLVDELQTSDDYILAKLATHHVFAIKAYHKQPMLTKLVKSATHWLHPFA